MNDLNIFGGGSSLFPKGSSLFSNLGSGTNKIFTHRETPEAANGDEDNKSSLMVTENQYSLLVNKFWDSCATLSNAGYNPEDEDEHFTLIQKLANTVSAMKADCDKMHEFLLEYSNVNFSIESLDELSCMMKSS